MEKNLFSKQECKNIIDRAESKNLWRQLNHGVFHYQISELPLTEDESSRIKNYCKKFLNIELNFLDASIMKYQKGDFIKKHVDRFIDIESKNVYHTRMLYNINMILNDDYTGGEFHLNNMPHIQDIGTVYHYKSDQTHEVKPIKSGTRYSVLFYIKEDYINRNNTII